MLPSVNLTVMYSWHVYLDPSTENFVSDQRGRISRVFYIFTWPYSPNS